MISYYAQILTKDEDMRVSAGVSDITGFPHFNMIFTSVFLVHEKILQEMDSQCLVPSIL